MSERQLNYKRFEDGQKGWHRRRNYSVIFMLSSIIALLWVSNSFSQQDELLIPTVQPPRITALDQPIDPSAYKVGPGDKASIFLWGNIQAQYNLTVSPEGKLLIPTVGPVAVSGMFLSEAKKKIRASVLKRFTNVRVAIELSDLRSFKVSIGGAVRIPGVYEANGVTRVSEVIRMAGGYVNESDDLDWRQSKDRIQTFPPGVASHRNIIVKHKNGPVDTADILLFEQTGDLTYNYKLIDGDEIFVPLCEDNINKYGIFGGVKNPAFYEYSARDSLKDLINLAHGLTLNVDSSMVELVRFAPDGKTVTRTDVALKEILNGESQDIELIPDDRVFIKTLKSYNEKHQVLVLGEVMFPGFYAIEPESTYLYQIMERAGGLTDLASLAEASMTRYTYQDIADNEFERLKLMEVADMNDLEYEYFKIKSREKRGRVSVDFVELFKGNGQGNIKLRNGDVIVIPKVSEVINVTGEVANPGLLTYDPELNFKDYINLAGGFTYRADKGGVRIINEVAGEWKKAKTHALLFPGDVILIPEKKKIDFINTMKDVITFAANLATVYLVIREATR